MQLGDTVELLKLGTKASVIAINKDGTYTLQAGILKLTARPEEVYLLEDANKFQVKKPRPAHSGREMKAAAMPTEIDLRGMDSIEAICVLDRFLDEAMRSNLSSVRIIHGKGTGALRAAVQEELRRNKFVKKFQLGRIRRGRRRSDDCRILKRNSDIGGEHHMKKGIYCRHAQEAEFG